jgi:hypothetical protein
MNPYVEDGRTWHDPRPAVRCAQFRREGDHAALSPAGLEDVMAATGALIEELTATGAFVFAGELKPPSSAITVENKTSV